MAFNPLQVSASYSPLSEQCKRWLCLPSPSKWMNPLLYPKRETASIKVRSWVLATYVDFQKDGYKNSNVKDGFISHYHPSEWASRYTQEVEREKEMTSKTDCPKDGFVYHYKWLLAPSVDFKRDCLKDLNDSSVNKGSISYYHSKAREPLIIRLKKEIASRIGCLKMSS